MYFRQSQPHSNAGQQFSQQCWGWPARCFEQGYPVTCISNCLLAVLRKVCVLEPCCLLANFCAVFFSSPPSLFSSGPGKGKKHIGWKGFHWPVHCDGAWWGSSQGCHGLYLLPCARALPSSTNFVGTSAQAHLLVISLTTTYVHCTCTVEPFVMTFCC